MLAGLCVSFGLISVWAYYVIEYQLVCCWLPPLLIALMFALIGLVRSFAGRGLLLLFPDRLAYRDPLQCLSFWSGLASLSCPLPQIQRVVRSGNRIRFVLRDARWYSFECSKPHIEDLFDQLVAQLDALGVDVATVESTED